MRVHTIITYFDGQHGDAFHVLTDDDYALLHALEIIKTSPEVQHFTVDFTDGFEFYEKLFKHTHSLQNTNQTAEKE